MTQTDSLAGRLSDWISLGVLAKPMRSKPLFGYANSFEGVGNSTDVGDKGVPGPGTITLVNGTPTY
jgi:hypothetical protein